MQISLRREELLTPLSYVAGVVERRQTLPVLSYVLLKQQNGETTLTGTDLEIEIIARIEGVDKGAAEMMLPARKLLDICRALPNDAEILIKKEGEKIIVKAGKSRFTLTTLPVTDFPNIQTSQWEQALTISKKQFRELLQQTHFCMAQQDVRYYLNGLLLEIKGNHVRAVATDGHRMALSQVDLGKTAVAEKQVIVPRKGIQEILRLLDDTDEQIEIQISNNHIRAQTQGFTFTSKLIDGRYPDYTKVMPSSLSKQLKFPRDEFKETLSRVAILSSEKYRGARLSLGNRSIKVTAHNPEQEEAQEEIAVDYTGEAREIGLNVSYMIEALNALNDSEMVVGLNDPNSSCTITAPSAKYPQYVIMPMRL